MAVRSLIVALEARTQAFETALNRTERKVADFERSIAKVQRVLSFAATAGGIAVASKKLFDLGSAVEETRQKFETVFGAATESVTRFGREFATMAGLSQRTFQDMASTVGAVAQGMGYAEQESAAFAQQVLKLAGDVAAFNNLQTDDVVQRMTAALTGERESMKRLGIVITETEVQQKAFAATGKTVAATLTQQEKAAATMELMIQKSGRAVGYLAKESESAAAKARAVRAEFQTIAETFAARLLPALSSMLPALEALIPPMARLAELAGQFVGGLAQLFDRGLDQKLLARAEATSLAGLGAGALPGARARFNAEIQSRIPQLANLQASRDVLTRRALPTGWIDQQIAGLVAEIRLYGELIAKVNDQLIAPVAAMGGGPGAAVRSAGSRSRSFPTWALPSEFSYTGAGLRSITPQYVEQNPIPEQLAAAGSAFQDAAGVAIASFGAMAQAAIMGSSNMAQAVIAGFTQIGQALAGMQLGGLFGPILGAVGGILGSLFAGGRDKPQPVVIQDVSEGASDKLTRRREGPDRVQIYVVDSRANVRSIVDTINRATQRDAAPRLVGAV